MPVDNTEVVTKRKYAWQGNAKRRLKFWTNVCLSVALFAGIALAVAHGGNVSTAAAWAGAALGTGSVLGFLFGVPGRPSRRIVINQPGVAAIDTGISRATGTGGGTVTSDAGSGAVAPRANSNVPVPPASAATESDPSSSAANQTEPSSSAASQDQTTASAPSATSAVQSGAPPDQPAAPQPPEDSNLVQVSDWVTKLLLGGGLTQLQQIPPKIWELARWVAIGIDPSVAIPGKETGLQSNQSFAAGLLIYFFVLGFFGGYFITQLQFKKRLQS